MFSWQPSNSYKCYKCEFLLDLFNQTVPGTKPPPVFYNSKASLPLSLRSTSLSMQTPWPPTSPRSWTQTNTVTSFPPPSTCHEHLFPKTGTGGKRGKWKGEGWGGREDESKDGRREDGEKRWWEKEAQKKGASECGYGFFCFGLLPKGRHTHTHTHGHMEATVSAAQL